jgi:hypothetical protein
VSIFGRSERRGTNIISLPLMKAAKAANSISGILSPPPGQTPPPTNPNLTNEAPARFINLSPKPSCCSAKDCGEHCPSDWSVVECSVCGREWVREIDGFWFSHQPPYSS